jgi:hypothetical protein
MCACGNGDTAEALLVDYLKRVERATGIKSKLSSQVDLLPYPSHREQNLQVAPLRMGMVNFAKLYPCDLFKLINERNSIMGRVMPISQKLVYEIAFLQDANVCYQKLAATATSNKEFLSLFKEVIKKKQANLPIIFWQATFNSPELKKLFSLAVSPLNPDEDQAFLNARQSVAYFRELAKHLTSGSLAIDKEELETHYFRLQRYQYGGRLLQSVAQLTDYLNRAAYSLETLMSEAILCVQKKPTEQAYILNNVFRKYYAQRVGAYISQIHRQGQTWLADIDALVQAQTVNLPFAFIRYRAQMLNFNSGIWQGFDVAIQRHTQAWQAVLSQCGLMPAAE